MYPPLASTRTGSSPRADSLERSPADAAGTARCVLGATRRAPRAGGWALGAGRWGYAPRIIPNISGSTIDASDSITNFGVSTASLPQVIFSLGTAPEYEP